MRPIRSQCHCFISGKNRNVGTIIIYRSAWNIRKTNFRVHFLFFDFGAFDADTWSALAPVWPHRDVSDTALPNPTTHVGWRCGSGCVASASSRQNRGAERSAQGAETSARSSNKRAEEPGWAHWCKCADMCVFYFLGFCPASWQGLWRHWPIYSEFPSSLQTAELACHACSAAKETPKVAQSSREAGLWRPEVATCPACCDRRTSWMSLLHWCIFFSSAGSWNDSYDPTHISQQETEGARGDWAAATFCKPKVLWMNFLQVLPFDVVRQARKGEAPKVLTLRTAHRAGDARKITAGRHCVQSVSQVETT